MKKYIIIKADTNDADYVISKNLISDEQFEKIIPVINEIKNCKEHINFPYSEFQNKTVADLYPGLFENQSEDEYPEIVGLTSGASIFINLIPNEEYGIHTIKSIDVLVVQEEIKLL